VSRLLVDTHGFGWLPIRPEHAWQFGGFRCITATRSIASSSPRRSSSACR
jgi:hypothetical protein